MTRRKTTAKNLSDQSKWYQIFKKKKQVSLENGD